MGTKRGTRAQLVKGVEQLIEGWVSAARHHYRSAEVHARAAARFDVASSEHGWERRQARHQQSTAESYLFRAVELAAVAGVAREDLALFEAWQAEAREVRLQELGVRPAQALVVVARAA